MRRKRTLNEQEAGTAHEEWDHLKVQQVEGVHMMHAYCMCVCEEHIDPLGH